MDKIKFYDTSALLGGAELDENSFLSSTVIDELEHIKTSSTKDNDVKYKARALVRRIVKDNVAQHKVFAEKDIQKVLKKYDFLAVKNDSRIICEALLLNKIQPVTFITQDACQYLIIKERFPELNVEYYEEIDKSKKDIWPGYKILDLNQQELEYIYSNPENNLYNLQINEYGIIKENGEVKDLIKWDGFTYKVIEYKNIYSDYFGTIKPKNEEQELAFDLLQNNNIPIKVLRSGYGTGKTFLSFCWGINQVLLGKYRKIVFIRNNVEVQGTGNELGILPGGINEKLYQFILPIADILGSEDALNSLLEQGFIEMVHVGTLRGRSFSDCFIIVDEAENITTNIAKLIIGRIGEGSQIVFCGDEKQTDKFLYEKNSGMLAVIKALKGNSLFGTVELKQGVRSRTAECAELIQ